MSKQEISVSVDSVVFHQNNTRLKVLLVLRKNEPFKGEWALPGGFLEEKETLEDGAKRELEEETGLKVDRLHQIRAFGDPDRDPRGRTISIAFVGKVKEESAVKGNDDAAEAKWFDIDSLPDLAFDHVDIIESAKRRL